MAGSIKKLLQVFPTGVLSSSLYSCPGRFPNAGVISHNGG